MAIFYEKIKGCSTETTGNNSEQKDLWTFLKWGSASGLKTHTIENFRTQFIPSLIVSGSGAIVRSETDKSVYDFGRLIVSGQTPDNPTNLGTEYYGQYLYTDLCIDKTNTLHLNKIEGVNQDKMISFNECLSVSKDTIDFHTSDKNSDLNFVLKNKDSTTLFEIAKQSNVTRITSKVDTIAFNNIKTCTFTAKNNETNDYPFQFTGDVKMDGNISVTGSLTSTSKIEALYFNATSDFRAKTILGKVPNALNTIVDTPIYEYFYTDDAKKTELIGILAQDLLKNGDEFHIVNNQSATGVNGDYMTIKEDRLVFVLWKAVQELEAKIKTLRQEVKELREGK